MISILIEKMIAVAALNELSKKQSHIDNVIKDQRKFYIGAPELSFFKQNSNLKKQIKILSDFIKEDKK